MSNFFGKIFTKKTIQKQPEAKKDEIITIGKEFISSSSMVLDRRLSGDFYALEQIVIEVDAYITGNIVAPHCIIKGRLNGSVLCLKNIIIKNTAIFEGGISTGTVEIESGALINGCITLQGGLQSSKLFEKVKEAEKFKIDQPTSPLPVETKEYPMRNESFSLPVISHNSDKFKNTEPSRKTTLPYNNGESGWW